MTRTAVLISLALAAATACRGAEVAAPVPASPPAKVHTILAGHTPGGTSAAASVAAVDRATLSTRLAATVQAVHVAEGQQVKKGQLLVSLSDADLRGGLAAAETGLETATAQERRIVALAAQRAATPAEQDLARAQRSQAEAAVAGARASLTYTQLRAPFAGTVQARRVEAGDLVGPGQPVVVLEGDALELVASLSEAEASGLSVGTEVPFEAGAARGVAVVTALTPGGDPVSHRRGVRARVMAAQGELRSGAFARLLLPGAAAAAATWVPRSALVTRGDLTGVFVVASGKAELRWIAPGESAGDGLTVRAGLASGEPVVDAPGALRDGDRVEVLP
jgi:RND family efflux transporter MFP subunit